MRYYVMTVEFNKDAQAENRSVPKAFDKRDDAIRQFHKAIADDMGNATLGWALVMLINSEGGVERVEKWVREEEVVEAAEVVEEE